MNTETASPSPDGETPMGPDPHGTPPLAAMAEEIAATIREMGQASDLAVAMSDEINPGWQTTLQKGVRAPLTEWHCRLSMAWACATPVATRDAGLDETFTTISRTTDVTQIVSMGARTGGTMDFADAPASFPVPAVPIGASVEWQREQVARWLGRAVGWAEVFVRACDLSDSTWEDLDVAADGPGASFPLFHLWRAWQALVDYATDLRVPAETIPTYPARARVTSLRYAPVRAEEREPATYAPGPDALWVRAERKRRGWSQSELGRRAGIGQGTVSGIETGRVELSAATLARIKAVFPVARRSTADMADDASAGEQKVEQEETHRHVWVPFLGPDRLPALVRCDGCGWSVLTDLAAATGLALATEPHEHRWDPLFDDTAAVTVLWCGCGALVPVRSDQ